MVLLILAVLWAIVLVPPKLRSRSESKRMRSIRRFRRRLDVLAPPIPASRPEGASRPVGAARPHVAVIANGARPVRLPVRDRGDSSVAEESVDGTGALATTAAATAGPAPAAPAPVPAALDPLAVTAARRRAMFRRRRIFAALLVAMVFTLVLGAQPFVAGLRPLLALHVVVDVAIAGYVVWLRRTKRADVREIADARSAADDVVRYLPPADARTGEIPVAAVIVERRVRRSATS